jgi:hypothetical protein
MPSYYYNWNTQKTDDPRLQGKNLPYGEGNKILLDGEDVSSLHIFEIKTGPDGFIRHRLHTTEFGEHSRKLYSRPLMEIVDKQTGKVWLETDEDRPQWQVRSPENNDTRYEERYADRTVKGNVVYETPGV